MKIIYASESIEDLKRLREFIEVNNPSAAQRIATELIQGIQRLKTFPKIGLSVFRAPNPELLRDLYIDNYTVRYLIGNNTIHILRIWHGKENEKNL